MSRKSGDFRPWEISRPGLRPTGYSISASSSYYSKRDCMDMAPDQETVVTTVKEAFSTAPVTFSVDAIHAGHWAGPNIQSHCSHTSSQTDHGMS